MKLGPRVRIMHSLNKRDKGYKDEGIPYGLWYSSYDTLEPEGKGLYLFDKDLKDARAVYGDPHEDDHAFSLIRLRNGQFVYVMGIDIEEFE